MKKYFKLLLASMAISLTTACAGGGSVDFTGDDLINVTSFTMDDAALELEIGDTYKLTTHVESEKADKLVIGWRSSNTRIVKVDNEGLIEAVNSGDAVVSAFIENGKGSILTSCRVKVNGATVIIDDDITYFSLLQHSVRLATGATLELDYETLPASAKSSIYIEWASSDESIVGVSSGTLTAYKAGEVDITATTGDFSDTCHVVVYEKGQEGEFSITLNESSKTLMVGATFQLTATVSTPATVTWRSNDATKASVSSNGLVTALAAGTVSVVAMANGYEAKCIFTITNSSDVPVGRDPDVVIYFFIDYNSYDMDDTTGTKKLAQFDWYSEIPLSKSGLVPPTPSEAPDPAFPYFAGWSDHTIIDTKDDLWNMDTDVVPLGTYFLALYGIWSDVEDFNL